MLLHRDLLGGIEYEIHIVPLVGEDWKNKDRGKFYAVCQGMNYMLFPTFKECSDATKVWIDTELSKVSNSVEELTYELSDLLVWEDYEVCHFDTVRAEKIINNFINKHYTPKG